MFTAFRPTCSRLPDVKGSVFNSLTSFGSMAAGNGTRSFYCRMVRYFDGLLGKNSRLEWLATLFIYSIINFRPTLGQKGGVFQWRRETRRSARSVAVAVRSTSRWQSTTSASAIRRSGTSASRPAARGASERVQLLLGSRSIVQCPFGSVCKPCRAGLLILQNHEISWSADF